MSETTLRVDVYLNRVCLLKSRSLAKEACDRGKVRINGEPAKASREVREGDRIRLDLGVRIREIEVRELPPRAVSKKLAPRCYRVLVDERVEEAW